MAYDTPDFTDLDLSTGWTEQNSPTFEDGPNGGTDNALIGDDTALVKLTNAIALVPAGATNFTIGIWLKMDDTEINEIAISQFATGPDTHDFDISSLTGSTYQMRVWNDNATEFTITQSSVDQGDDTYKFMMFSVSPSSIDIFTNGVEDSYSVKDANTLGGFDVVQATPIVTVIGEWSTPTANRYWSGGVGPLYIWHGVADSDKTLTAAQALEFYDDITGTPVLGGPDESQRNRDPRGGVVLGGRR